MKDWLVYALVGLVAVGLAIGLISGPVDGDRPSDSGSPVPTGAELEPLEPQRENGPRFLFVASGSSGSLECGRLRLAGVPFVVFFSDRPYRMAGHISVERLVDAWDEGEDSFRSDPPNAALSVFGASGSTNVVVELKHPFLVDGDLTFDITILQGSLPASFGPCSLFIDTLSYEKLFSLMLERANRQEQEISDVKDRLEEAREAGNDEEAQMLQIQLQELLREYSHTVNLETNAERTISGDNEEGNIRQP
jgi:hypothetical protein